MKVSVIIPAAGLGTRMGRGAPEKEGISRKQFMLLNGSPILIHTIRKFVITPLITEIVVALRGDDIAWANEHFAQQGFPKLVRAVEGGESRQQSVENALATISDDTDLVAVHDAVRPFIDAQGISDYEPLRRDRRQRLNGLRWATPSFADASQDPDQPRT